MGKGQWAIDIAQQAAGGVVGTGLGLLLEGHNDRRQLEQQRKLQQMQEDAQVRIGKTMGDYNLANAKEMWEYTGYGRQKQQIEEAGLNPALMYGMKGGGGITTGPTASAGSVTGGEAIKGGPEAMGGMAMGMQLGLMRAQKELIEAQRDKINAEIPNLPKTGANIEATTAGTMQQISESKTRQALMEVQTKIAGLEEQLKRGTLEENIQLVTAATAEAQQRVMQMEVKTEIDRATKTSAITRIHAQSIGAILANEVMRKGMQKTDKEIWKMQAEVENIYRQGAQGWSKIGIEGQNADQQGTNLRHQQWVNDIQQSTQLPIDVIEKVIQAVVLKGLVNPAGPNPVRGLHNR